LFWIPSEPALTPDASRQGSPRSQITTSRPARARNSAVARPWTPAPATTTSVRDGHGTSVRDRHGTDPACVEMALRPGRYFSNRLLYLP
jgi:hypothetical protein